MQKFENSDPAKRAAGYAAVDKHVVDGTCIGLGTGTTAYWAIERVGQRIAAGDRISAVATSSETEELCRRLRIPLVELLEEPIAVAIDGADEVAPDWSLTKGGGGALFRENRCALRRAIRRRRYRIETSRSARRLSTARRNCTVCDGVRAEGIQRRCGDVPVVRRETAGRPFVTDNENWIFDCHFARIDDPPDLDARLRGIHGVVSTGLFFNIASEVLVGGADGRVVSLPPVSRDDA